MEDLPWVHLLTRWVVLPNCQGKLSVLVLLAQLSECERGTELGVVAEVVVIQSLGVCPALATNSADKITDTLTISDTRRAQSIRPLNPMPFRGYRVGRALRVARAAQATIHSVVITD